MPSAKKAVLATSPFDYRTARSPDTSPYPVTRKFDDFRHQFCPQHLPVGTVPNPFLSRIELALESLTKVSTHQGLTKISI